MNSGLRLLLIHMLLVGCASTPKATVKKKPGAAATTPKTAKGSMPVKGGLKPKAVVPTPTPTPEPEVEEVEEEEDDQFSRIKKYYKK
ncbi:MAG TPA: hypothetical protein VE954_34155 [Oligoflexus sp.]|uniref:hypothetical protein n=1 Tax=Oligoflexus sp. TaxID=1971216 RepID=UPI002D365021|nr:hypothetical protein [Oligoflexus sp.]HYX38172.1 hypothetical protein [Oligoflexus sp.]